MALFAAAVLVLLVGPNARGRAQAPAPTAPPAHLRDTGLYSDWATRTVSAEHLTFSPQYPLWSDGAEKRRYIHLPEGSFIDGSDPDAWVFPIGTRLWKEFRFHGRRVETRYIERLEDGTWLFAAYAWSDDETEAVLAPARGALASTVVRDGMRHRIPGRLDCLACHEGGTVPVLGFTALQLSPDRDPGALHAEEVSADAVDLRALVERGWLRHLPPHLLTTTPRIAARTPTARAALGYLQTNCGVCHNATGALASLGLALEQRVGAEAATEPVLPTAVGQRSRFRLPGPSGGESDRIVPGDPDRSTLVVRMASRHPSVQMPPLGTQIVDEEAVALLRRWISDELAPPRLAASHVKESADEP